MIWVRYRVRGLFTVSLFKVKFRDLRKEELLGFRLTREGVGVELFGFRFYL